MRKGVFGLSFQTIFNIVAALLIGLGVYALFPGFISQLSSLSGSLMQQLTGGVAGYEQIALDSTEALSIAMSCTSLLNAVNAESPTGYQNYLQEEWNTWNNGICNEAETSEDGVSIGSKDVVRVKCDAFDPSNPTGGKCDVYNFQLPNDFDGSWTDWIRAYGEPRYVVYYNAFPDTGIEEDWETKITGTNIRNILMMGGFNAILSAGPAVAKRVIPDTAINTMRNGVRSLIDSISNNLPTNTRFKDRFDEAAAALRSVGDTVKRFALWDTAARFDRNAFSRAVTATTSTGVDDIGRLASQQGFDTLETALDDPQFAGQLSKLLLDGADTQGIRQVIDNPNALDNLDSLGIDDRIRNILDESSDGQLQTILAAHNARTGSDEFITQADFINQFRQLLDETEGSFTNHMRYLSRGRQDALDAGIPENLYYRTVQRTQSKGSSLVSTVKEAAEEGGDSSEALDAFLSNDQSRSEAMQGILGDEALEQELRRSQSLACGSGMVKNLALSNAYTDAAEELLNDDWAAGTAAFTKCAALSGAGNSMCSSGVASSPAATSNTFMAACVGSMLLSGTAMRDEASEIKKETVGINSIAIKRQGLQEPETFDLHPVTNWYYAQLQPKESLTPSRRLYMASPCNAEPESEDSEARLEVTHDVAACYRVADAGKVVPHEEDLWSWDTAKRTGQDRIPADVFTLGLQGSYYHHEAGGWFEELTRNRDIVYTEHPYVWTKPKWEDDTSDTHPALGGPLPPGFDPLVTTDPDNLEGGDLEQDDIREGWYSNIMVKNPEDPNVGLTNEEQEQLDQYRSNIQRLDKLKQEQFQASIDEGVEGIEDEHLWSSVRKANSTAHCDIDAQPEGIDLTAPGKIEGTMDTSDIFGGNPRIGAPETHTDDYLGGDIITWYGYCENYVSNMSRVKQYYFGEDGDRIYYSQLGYWRGSGESAQPIIPYRYISADGSGTKYCPSSDMWSAATDYADPFDSNMETDVDALSIRFKNYDFGEENYCYKATSWTEYQDKGGIVLGTVILDAATWAAIAGSSFATGGVGAVGGFIVGYGVGMGEEYMWQCVTNENAWPQHSGAEASALDQCAGDIIDFTEAIGNGIKYAVTNWII